MFRDFDHLAPNGGKIGAQPTNEKLMEPHIRFEVADSPEEALNESEYSKYETEEEVKAALKDGLANCEVKGSWKNSKIYRIIVEEVET